MACFLPADSEEEVAAPVKKPKTVPTSAKSKGPGKGLASSKVTQKSKPSPGKSPASSKVTKKSNPSPRKSPANSKTIQKKIKASPLSSQAKKITTTIADFFGSTPIKRSRQVEKRQVSTVKTTGSNEGKSSHTSSEVTVIPESPAESAEFDDVAMAFLQEEEREKGEQEVCRMWCLSLVPV